MGFNSVFKGLTQNLKCDLIYLCCIRFKYFLRKFKQNIKSLHTSPDKGNWTPKFGVGGKLAYDMQVCVLVSTQSGPWNPMPIFFTLPASVYIWPTDIARRTVWTAQPWSELAGRATGLTERPTPPPEWVSTMKRNHQSLQRRRKKTTWQSSRKCIHVYYISLIYLK